MILHLSTGTRAHTLRAMASERYRDALACLERGDLDGFMSRFRDVDALRAEATRLDELQRRLDEERDRTVAAAVHILALAQRGN